jgi:hypothetical protein
MTDEQIIRAVAELDGWYWCEENHQSNISKEFSLEKKEWHNKDKTEWLDYFRLPKYLTSYDAIIPVVQRQIPDIQYQMPQYLPCSSCGSFSQIAMRLINCTPRQLCEALLRATGKWVE